MHEFVHTLPGSLRAPQNSSRGSDNVVGSDGQRAVARVNEQNTLTAFDAAAFLITSLLF